MLVGSRFVPVFASPGVLENAIFLVLCQLCVVLVVAVPLFGCGAEKGSWVFFSSLRCVCSGRLKYCPQRFTAVDQILPSFVRARHPCVLVGDSSDVFEGK